MRGARRSHNTVARTADRHPRSAGLSVRRHGTVRPAAQRRLARPAPTTQSRSINDGADRSLADAPSAREDRGLVLHRRRRLTKGPRREARPPERAPRLLLSMRKHKRSIGALPIGEWDHEAPLLRRMLYHRLPDGARAHAVSTYVTTTAGRSGRARGLEKRALRPICEDTRNAVRARVRLCPTACPTRREFPMVKPDQSGIIIRGSGADPRLEHSGRTSQHGRLVRWREVVACAHRAASR
jgi:hypothetical protein